MYCKRCGKEISDEAFMCPSCGEPTDKYSPAQQKQPRPSTGTDRKTTAIASIGFTLSLIAFVTGTVFGSFFFFDSISSLLLYVISATTILPALTGLCVGIYLLVCNDGRRLVKAFATCSVVFSAIVLAFLFVGGCVIIGNYL